MDDDTISLTSTRSENFSSDEEFLVEGILAEKRDKKNKPLYLISWANYPLEKSTWEPKKNIQDPEILQTWEKRKNRIALGTEPAFDLASFDALNAKIEKEKAERHLRRNAKRRRLGIPVAPSEETESDDEGSWQIDEKQVFKVKPKEIPEDEPVVTRKTTRPLQSQKKARTRREPEPELPDIDPHYKLPSDLQEDGESEPSDLDRDFLVGNKKKAQRKALDAIRQRRSAQNSPKVSSGGGGPGTKQSAEVQVTTKSAIDAQLLEELPQQQKPVLNPVQSQRKLVTSSTNIQSSLPNNAIHEEKLGNILGRPSTDGDRPARGKGARRGGRLTNRNVFERREPSKRRPNLLEMSSDPNKGQKLFPNWRLRRKVELASRSMADAPPDLTALGGLIDPSDPSDPSSLQPLTPATLRQSKTAAQAALESEQSAATGEPKGITDDMMREPSDISSFSRPDYVPGRHGFHAVCYFWHSRGGCFRGIECAYSHSDDPRLPIAPDPHLSSKGRAGREIREARVSETSPPPSGRHSINEICFFWHRDNSCSKGAECLFVHDNYADFPVARDPTYRKGKGPLPHYPSDRQDSEGHRQVENEKEVQEAKGGGDDYQTANRDLPPEITVPDALSYTPPARENPPTRAAEVDSSTRPPWDSRDPFRAICYFWHSGHNSCSKGKRCVYLHSFRDDLPLAPHPSDRSNVPCRFWPRDCHRGERCPYLHASGSLDPPLEPAPIGLRKSASFAVDDFDSESLDPPLLGPVPTGPRKSVSFVVDDPKIESDKLVAVRQNKVPGPPLEETRQLNETCFLEPRDECIREECNHTYETHSYESDGRKQTPQDIGYPSEQTANGDADLNYPELFAESELSNYLHSIPPSPLGDQLQSPSNLEPSDVENMMWINGKWGDNIKKISMEEYMNKKADNKLVNDRVKNVIVGSDKPQSIVLDFGDIGAASQQAWGQSFSALRIFHFRQMCTTQDFRTLYGSLPRDVLWSGKLVPNPPDKSTMVKMDKFCQHLRLYSGGLISTFANFAILIYPTTEEWKVLGPSVTFSPDESLRYLIFQPNGGISKPLSPKGGTPSLFRKTLVKSLQGLRYRQFLQPERAGLVHNFYLMFPSGANGTAAFFATWLRASDSRCKVYSSQIEGSWDFFASSPEIQAGVVLIHESIMPYISEIPSLYRLINPPTHSRTFTFWCIGDSGKKYSIFQTGETSNLGQLSVIRIFPHGHAIFLTPSFLVAEPEKACHIIEWFGRKAKISTPRTWKLVCAYDIRSYLLQLAMDKSSERDQFYVQNDDKPAKDSWASERGLSYQECVARFKCHAMISDMIQEGTKDRLLESYDSDFSSDGTTPIVYADESIDPDNEQGLITWFVGWSIRNLDRFRKYTVVGTNSSSSKKAVRKKRFTIKGTAGHPQSNASNPPSIAPSSGIIQSPNKSPAEVSAGLERKTTIPTSFGDASESGIHFDASMLATSHNHNSPQNLPSNSGDGSVEMDTSSDSEGTIFAKARTLDPESAPEILFFCSRTGCNTETARGYLHNSRNNLQAAINLFKTHNSREQMDRMDIDGQILDMIASVKAEQQMKQLPRLVTESAASSTNVPSDTQTGVYSPQYDPSPISPSQFDGLGAQAPQLGSNNDPVKFWIKNISKEHPRLRNAGPRATDTEANGSVHFEDREVNRNRRIDSVLKSAANPDTSRRGSYASLAAQSPMGEITDADSPRRGLNGTFGTEVRYGSTTSWYKSLKPGGKEWEHIYLDAADGCIKVIGIKGH